MKSYFKKVVYLLLALMIIMSLSTMAVFAEDTAMNITIRIEGIDENMYYENVSVPYNETLTLQAALTFINTQEEGLTITGIGDDYITDINGDAAGNFGGWDGWVFMVNGISGESAISGCELSEGDNVVLYYGDPFGIGMQYPKVDISDISNGIVKFTSLDTTYDADYNPTTSQNPVVGATVKWDETEYITDDNGQITVETAKRGKGTHTVQISKTSDEGLPLVLRLASDHSVIVEADVSNPQTGDPGALIYIIFVGTAAFIFLVSKFLKSRKYNEN